jgi:hypothetical protein
MSTIDLAELLPIVDGALTIGKSLASGPVLADQLSRLTGGLPIVVRDAVATAIDGPETVVGTASLLRVNEMPVKVTAINGQHGPVVTIRFSLSNGPNATAWQFSQSFPDLPDFSPSFPGGGPNNGVLPTNNLLDRLTLSDAAFVLTTAPTGIDPVTGARVQAGFNFVAHCAPFGLVGVLEGALATRASLVLSGPVILPKATELTLPAESWPLVFPWQRPQPPPGINLSADLGIDQTLGTALRLHDVGLRIYCPTSNAWAAANPTYSPMLAAVGELDVPSAGISLDLTALGLSSPSGLMLFGIFDGVTFGKLEQLVDLAGNNDLASRLPSDVQDALGALSEISLRALTVQLGKGFTVSNVGVAVGLAGVGTSVLPGFAASDLIANFNVSHPFGADRTLCVTLEGQTTFLGASFTVAIDLTDLSATAQLTDGVSLPLRSLFSQVGLPAPPDLTINEMELGISKDGSFSVAAAMATAPAWTLDLGPVPLTVSDVRVLASRPASGPSSGSFSGGLALGEGLELAFSYQTPGDFTMQADLPEVRLMQLVDRLTNQDIKRPRGFDLDFTDGSVLIQKAGADLLFQFATVMDSLGTVAFEACRTGSTENSWGFAVGIDLMNGLRPSGLPGLGGLKIFDDLFRLGECLVVVSSLADPSFTFPDLAAFDSPALKSGNLKLPAQASGVIAGLNVYANWAINTADPQQKLLGKILGLDPTIGITLQVGEVPEQDSRLYVSYNTRINGMPLQCQFGGQLEGGRLGLFLDGSLQTRIQGHLAEFDVTLLFVANGAFLSGSMLGSVQFEDGIILSNLVLVIGTDWEGIPSLGIAATLSVDHFQSSLAVFFDSANPALSMLAGSVSNLSLKDVVETFARSVPSTIDDVLARVGLVGTNSFTIGAELAEALDNLGLGDIAAAFAEHGITLPTSSAQVLMVASKPGQSWFLTDMTRMLHYEFMKAADGIKVSLEPQFFSIPQDIAIGDLNFKQGRFLNTGLDVLSFRATVEILVSPSQGISVDGRMSRVVIGTEALFRIESADGHQGPRVSVSTYNQPSQQDPALRGPHFLIDGLVDLLGLSQRVYINVSTRGFEFQMNGTMEPAFHYNMEGHFQGPQDLGATGSLEGGVGTIDLGVLGKADVGSGVKGALEVGVNAHDIFARFDGGFEFAGDHLNLPRVALDVRTASLPGLPKTLAELVTAALKDLLKDASHWAKLVKGHIITGVDDVGKALKTAYGATADQASSILKDAGYPAEDVGNALKSGYGETIQQAAQSLKDAGYAVNDIGNALKSGWGGSADTIAGALKGAGFAVNEVGGYVKDAFHLGPDDLKKVLQGVGFSGNQVKDFFHGLGGDFEKSFDNIGRKLDPKNWFHRRHRR